MQTAQWTPERLKEIRAYKKLTKSTWPETAAHFKVDSKKLVSAFHYHLPKKPKKQAKASNPPTRKYTKKPTYIDIVAAPSTGMNVTVVRCQLTQLASVLKGFE